MGIVLCTSIITGTVIGILLKWNPLRRLLKKLKVQIISPIPSAWDFEFSELNQGKKVTVALSDGTFIRGAYYSKSMAFSDDGYRDIYLEETWQLDEQDRWVKVDATDGVWISPNVIKWISFMEDANDVGE